MGLQNFLHKILLQDGVDRQLLRKIEEEDFLKTNYTTISVFSLVGFIFVSIMLVTTWFNPVLQRHRVVYIVGSVASLLLFVVNQLMFRKNPRTIPILMYAAFSLYIAYGIALGIYTDPGMQSTTFLVMMIFVPMIFVDRPHRMIIAIVIADMIFIGLVLHIKTGAVRTADLTDSLVFGGLSIIGTSYMMKVKIQRYVYARQMYYIGSYDQLTNLKNRNSFEREKDSFPENCSRCLTVVYADGNGLYVLNDTFGHEEGDRMLKCVSENMRAAFGSENTYRLGGDEFISLIPDLEEAEVHSRLDSLTRNVAAEGFSVSFGVSRQEKQELDLNEVIRTAEQKMYRAKDEYYSRTGSNRGKRY